MRERWDLRGDQVTGVDLDPKTHETRVRTTSGAVMVVSRTRACRSPTPLPIGNRAEIMDASHVTTDEAAILTLVLRSGDTVQVAGSGLSLV